MKTLEKCFNVKIDREMGNIIDTVQNRIQNSIMTGIDTIITAKFELAVRSMNASSRRVATSVTANSECRDYIGITASFENLSEMNYTLHVFNTIDETRNDIVDEVGELSVPRTHFDRQPHTHHIYCSKNWNWSSLSKSVNNYSTKLLKKTWHWFSKN